MIDYVSTFDWQHPLFLIVLDKVLLAGVFLLLGYFASKKLESFRAANARGHYLHTLHVQAFKETHDVIIIEIQLLERLSRQARAVLAEGIGDVEAFYENALDYAAHARGSVTKIRSHRPFLLLGDMKPIDAYLAAMSDVLDVLIEIAREAREHNHVAESHIRQLKEKTEIACDRANALSDSFVQEFSITR